MKKFEYKQIDYKTYPKAYELNKEGVKGIIKCNRKKKI